jgi:hypothetical protein
MSEVWEAYDLEKVKENILTEGNVTFCVSSEPQVPMIPFGLYKLP